MKICAIEKSPPESKNWMMTSHAEVPDLRELIMTMSIVRLTRLGFLGLLVLGLPLFTIHAEKYYKVQDAPEGVDMSKVKPPEPSKPVDPNMFKQFLVVDVSAQRVDYYKAGEVIFSTPASTGREDKSTKEGVYRITDKHQNWTSTLYNVSMPYFMRLNGGDVGLHAGYLPGYPASHGCIRMPQTAAIHLFEVVPVGTPVLIQGTAPDKEWIRAQYKVKRVPSSTSYSRGTPNGGQTGATWQPPYPIIHTPDFDAANSSKADTPKPEPKKKKSAESSQ